MDAFNSYPRELIAALRLGQKQGFIAGVAFSTGTYFLAKAYKPALQLRMKKKNAGSES